MFMNSLKEVGSNRDTFQHVNCILYCILYSLICMKGNGTNFPFDELVVDMIYLIPSTKHFAFY